MKRPPSDPGSPSCASLMDGNSPSDRSRLYRAQHKRRLSWMPWLYFRLSPEHRQWAQAWQDRLHRRLSSLETVKIHPSAFVAPEARLFAEPGRAIIIGARTSVAADVFVHGPVELGDNVSLNPRVQIDGGSKGVYIGDESRIAAGVTIYAFDHGLASDRSIRTQNTRSEGVRIGKDVWVGANAGITDGVDIGDHAVIGMGAVVTQDVEPWTIVGGVPARPIRRRKP